MQERFPLLNLNSRAISCALPLNYVSVSWVLLTGLVLEFSVPIKQIQLMLNYDIVESCYK